MTIAILLAALQLGATPPAPATFDTMRSAPLTPGQWTYRRDATGSEAVFAGRLSLRCNRAAGTVTLRRLDVAGVASGQLTFWTDSVTRSLPAAGAILPARDPLLDAMAFSRGRFVVSGGGGTSLVVPAWPEAARSIEDCRN